MADLGNFQPLFVCSLQGLMKQVCRDGANCQKLLCSQAHPNAAGSVVQHPKWCLRGCVASCDSPTCPFNHFLTEAYFVKYRENDNEWAVANIDLVKKHVQSQPYREVFNDISEPVDPVTDNGHYRNGIWFPEKKHEQKIRKISKAKRPMQHTLRSYFEIYSEKTKKN